MNTVFLGLGSNVSDREKYIQIAVNKLKEKVSFVKLSPIYETKPVGFTKQRNFYNAVLEGKTSLKPEGLLAFVKRLERGIGRIKRFKNGPREIDIDILLYDNVVIGSEILSLPHPQLAKRDFVLHPFADISPNTIHPVLKKTIQELLLELPKNELSIVKQIKQQKTA